ncbi:hypothetical protein BJX61DRAFT_459966 [Aspergillus egyptiacus]|nr:hypothetical protein BJX61DRAFT_459966 [Aspergillus egyptiacus]
MALGSVSDDEISLTSTVESEQQSEYEVESILAEHEFPDGMRYLVRWANYSVDRSTWEPEEVFNDDDTLRDWEKKKRRIAEGKEPAFDVAKWEARLLRLEEERAQRKRRREAKRRKIASIEPNHGYQPPKDTPNGQIRRAREPTSSSSSRRPGPCSKSAPFDHVHPARARAIASIPPPVPFGNGQVSSARGRIKKPPTASDTVPSKRYTLHGKHRYEKAKNYEPAPNINELDLRRPSDWDSYSPIHATSANATQLGSSRLDLLRTDTTDTHNGLRATIESPTLPHPIPTSPVASASLSLSLQNGSRPERETANTTVKNLAAHDNAKAPGNKNTRKPVSEFTLNFPSREPSARSRRIPSNPPRWWNYGEVFVSMYFGENKQELGNARICGLPPSEWQSVMKSKVGNKIEVWFRQVCTLDDYLEICDHRTNYEYSNGWIEGYNDTEPNIRKAAETLWQGDLAAIAVLNKTNHVLLAYPPSSPSFKFLHSDHRETEKGYLHLILRGSLGSGNRLKSKSRNIHFDLSEVGNTAKSGHINTERETDTSSVRLLGQVHVAQEMVKQLPAASPRFDYFDPATSTSSLVQGEAIGQVPEKTDNSILPENDHLFTEPMDLDVQPNQIPKPANTGAGTDADADLDTYFRTHYGITFEALTAPPGTDKSQRVDMFYIWFPEDSEEVREEADNMRKFLRRQKHSTILFSTRVEEDWERFLMACRKGIMQGAILFHSSFKDYDKIPSFNVILRRNISCWNISLSQPLEYVDRPLHLQRIFPTGGVFLITEDFMLRDIDGTLVVLEWFSEWVRKKFPGRHKIMFRPAIFNWLLKQVEYGDKSKRAKWLAIYHLIARLDRFPADEILPSLDEDDTHRVVISLPSLPKYGSRTTEDSPNIPKDISQEYRNTDHLAEFFAGWSLVNADRFRRFVVLTCLPPLPRWNQWQHIELRLTRDFFATFAIDYKTIWAKLSSDILRHGPNPETSASIPEPEPATYTPRTPRAHGASTSSSDKQLASHTSLPSFQHRYAQPYQ